MKLFIDTWGWYALYAEDEPSHQRAKELWKAAHSQIYTTDYVLDELITLVFTKGHFTEARKFVLNLLKSIEQGYTTLESITPERFEKAWQMHLKYEDKPKISFTDFTSFVVMQELQISDVLTDDKHFVQINLGFQRRP
ncbi:MAG: PIN domain-containing protein [Candidatus Bipolaricaulota bacterium]|nr:PIN domain-containing protein [Candidatus Bipolaricaulota bacterium]